MTPKSDKWKNRNRVRQSASRKAIRLLSSYVLPEIKERYRSKQVPVVKLKINKILNREGRKGRLFARIKL